MISPRSPEGAQRRKFIKPAYLAWMAFLIGALITAEPFSIPRSPAYCEAIAQTRLACRAKRPSTESIRNRLPGLPRSSM
jgi:hypothetical protein